jgi:all-trans-retinol 13,14-reductase
VYLEAFDKEMIQAWGVPLSKELLPKAMPREWLQRFPATHQLMAAWQGMTYREVLDTYFQQEEIKTVLCSMLGYIGARATKNSAFSVVVASGYFFFGGYHILGGSQHLADVLAQYIIDRHGTVLKKHHSTSLLINKGTVEGVIVGNEEFKAPIVVSNVNAKTLYLDIIPEGTLPPSFCKEIQDLPMGRSAFLVFLGASQTFPTYPSIINDLDHRIHCVINSHNDPSTAPLGASSICIEQGAHMNDFPSPHSLEYDTKVANLMTEMIGKASLSLPGLTDHVVFKKAIAPRDLQELTAIPEGAVYCFDQSQVPIRPYFKTPIRGLYLANASSAGGGVEAVVMGGIICKHDITGWKRKKS